MRASLLTVWITTLLLPTMRALAGAPTLAIDQPCRELVPLYEQLPANDCQVTCLVTRPSDDLVIGATCGKQRICLFSFDVQRGEVKRLDSFEARWWDEPRVALGPNGAIYLAARRGYDKPFVFDRLRERPHTPDAPYLRRDLVPPPDQIDAKAPGMPIRHYSPDGVLQAEIALPEALSEDGIGALAVCAGGTMLCGLSAPGGRLFTIPLDGAPGRDYGQVVRFPTHHQTRPISRVLMPGDDGLVFVCGTHPDAKSGAEHGDDAIMGALLAFHPQTGRLDALNVQLPAVAGRHRLAAVDAAVRLADGSFLGGTSDGYLFHFDPAAGSVVGFGKPLRQHHICGLARGADGWVYGVGGEPGGLPRLFAFEPAQRCLHLGTSPTAPGPDAAPTLFGDVGAVTTTADGTLVCGERERRGYLLVYRAGAAPHTWRSVFEGRALARCTRDRFADFDPDANVIQLAPTYLISDAPARSGKIHEQLGTERFARKLFPLDRPCRAAQILFYGGGGTAAQPMLIRVNRQETLHIQDPQRMLTGGWDRETIPGAWLHVGTNELIFGRAGTLLIDTDPAGDHSFKAPQRWGPWKSHVLGPRNELAGEYVVRVRVHGHPPQGVATAPVIDLAQLAAGPDQSSLPPILAVARVRLAADAETPLRTAVRCEARAGTTPEYHPDTWSPWVAAEHSADQLPRQRYLQWRAILSSRDADATPRLRKMVIEVTGAVTGVNHANVRITQAPDDVFQVSSYPFDYPDPQHPRMRHLREKYRLAEVIAAGQTEAEKLALLRTWVRRQWEGWNDNKYNYCPPWDALEILELAPANLGLGMCTHYAAVFSQCAAALGFHARPLIVDHHCLAEVWSDQHSKWILQDPGLLPGHPVAFQYESNGVPINALELHQRCLAGSADDVTVSPDPPIPLATLRRQMLQLYVRFGIPLRNDHLYRPEPQEVEHGEGQYHWDGYLWWSDSLDPKYPEYSRLSNRPEDFYWTLNKTRIKLQDTAVDGTLSVHLSGPIPNLDRFMLRIDDGDWKACPAAFTWTLQRGKNTLQAKAINSMGIEGPPNRAELEYEMP